LFFHGWLFDGELHHSSRGISRYPFVGIFEPIGFTNTNPQDDTSSLSPFCPHNGVWPADFHAHAVEEVMNLDGYDVAFRDWHVGSDMAKIELCEEAVYGSCVGVCCDPHRHRLHISFLYFDLGFFSLSPNLSASVLKEMSSELVANSIAPLPLHSIQLSPRR
jgi:hypothetical protein